MQDTSQERRWKTLSAESDFQPSAPNRGCVHDLGCFFSFYTLTYRMQVQRLFASPSFSIPPKLILMLTVLPGCHACAQFASGLQVPGIASDQTWSRLAEKDRSESHWIHRLDPRISMFSYKGVPPNHAQLYRPFISLISIYDHFKAMVLGYPDFRKPPMNTFYSL